MNYSYDRSNEMPPEDGDFIAPINCPICGGKVIEMIYAFECEKCDWNEVKKFDE